MLSPRTVAWPAVLVSILTATAHLTLTAQELDPAAIAERLRIGLDEAQITGDDEAMDRMVTLARRAATAFPDDALINHYLGYALYRLAGPTMETDVDAALAMLAEAESFWSTRSGSTRSPSPTRCCRRCWACGSSARRTR